MRTKTKYQVILSSIKGEYYRKLDAVARREKSTIMIGGKKITPRFPFELANAAKELIFPSSGSNPRRISIYTVSFPSVTLY